jgi:RNA-splicing ligase RtcB
VNINRALKSLGTLGGGHHFIEIDKNSSGELFLIIHSGSRPIGNETARLYQRKATDRHGSQKEIKKLIKQLKKQNRQQEIQKALEELKSAPAAGINKNLAYLEGGLFNDYMNDMKIMQRYASVNRRTIADILLRNAGLTEESSFETIHNYIDFNRMILRKGAVSAEKGEKLLIPMNMRDGALICTGKGNPDWNYSAPHGAGRLMSRTEAKNKLSIDEFKKQMQGIYTTSVSKSTIDEAPGAYKPMEEIMEMISDTVDVIDILKPVYNFKAP